MARDDERFAEFVAANQHRMRRSAFLMCGDQQLAYDATQEALIRIYVAWSRLSHGDGLPTYVRKTVFSCVMDLQRRQARWRRNEDRVPVVDRVGDGTEERAERDALLQVLQTLPPRQRACVVLRYFDDLSVADTAIVLGCSIGTVKSQTSHALTALRREFARRGLPEPTLSGVQA